MMRWLILLLFFRFSSVFWRFPRIVTVVGMTAFLLMAGACTSRAAAPAPEATATATPSTPEPTPTPAFEESNEFATAIEDAFIQGNTFNPATMTVQVGTIVLWTNRDDVEHTVTGPGWELGPFDKSRPWAHTFNKVGVEEIHCRIHPNMTMTVTVIPKKQ